MRRALPAAGTFVLTLGLLDPIRLPELAAGLAAAAGSAALVLLLSVACSRAACRRHCREVPPPAAAPPAGSRWYSQPPTQPMDFGPHLYEMPGSGGTVGPVWVPPPLYCGPDLSSEAWPDGHEPPPADWDAVHRNVGRDWAAIMRRPDQQPGTSDMTEFEEEWKTP